jgi:hypothetical protein
VAVSGTQPHSRTHWASPDYSEQLRKMASAIV